MSFATWDKEKLRQQARQAGKRPKRIRGKYTQEFAPRLRAVREDRGYTQESFAKHLGIGWCQYNNYERGKVVPQLNQLVQIAEALDISIDYLTAKTPIKVAYTWAHHALARFHELPLNDQLDIANQVTKRLAALQSKEPSAYDRNLFTGKCFRCKETKPDCGKASHPQSQCDSRRRPTVLSSLNVMNVNEWPGMSHGL
jgi:transcriptional regulator with XRE-family HTH domain